MFVVHVAGILPNCLLTAYGGKTLSAFIMNHNGSPFNAQDRDSVRLYQIFFALVVPKVTDLIERMLSRGYLIGDFKPSNIAIRNHDQLLQLVQDGREDGLRNLNLELKLIDAEKHTITGRFATPSLLDS